MIRTRHDQFGKEFLAGLLDPFGNTDIDVKVTSEVRAIDLVFTPQPKRDPAALGLLGQIARTPCIFEPYRNPPTPQDLRICAMRLAIFEGEQRRRLSKGKPLPAAAIPWFWVIAPTLSARFLHQFGARPSPDWPEGVYALPVGFRGMLVAVHQLPVRRDTLWLRVLGRGSSQGRAIQEVLGLPESSPERTEVLRLLANWEIGLQQKEALAAEEQEMAVQLSQAYYAWEQKTLERGEQIGEQRGKLEIAQNLLNMGMTSEVIRQATGMTLEEIQQLQQNQSEQS